MYSRNELPRLSTFTSFNCSCSASHNRQFNLNVCFKRKLVSWCFKPSQLQRITSGLNTNFTLSESYSFHKSLHHKPYVFEPIYCSFDQPWCNPLWLTRLNVPTNLLFWVLNTGTCIQQCDLLYSAGQELFKHTHTHFSHSHALVLSEDLTVIERQAMPIWNH